MPGIYIYDDNQWAVSGWTFAPDTYIKVVSIADMVTKVLKTLKDDPKIHRVIWGGESGAGYKSVGANGLADTTGDRSFQLDENGELKGGGGRYLPLLKGRLLEVYISHLPESSDSQKLMIAISKALGVGTKVYSPFGLLYLNSEGANQVRRTTQDATVDREALKARLSQYTGK